MKVHILDSDDWKTAAKHAITHENVTKTIQDGLDRLMELLPVVSKKLNVVVSFNPWGVIPEYGVGGHTHTSEFIEIKLDPKVPYGAEKMLQSIYATVLHEGNHAARWNTVKYDDRFIASLPFEGLATVFERDYAKYQPLYGKYEDDKTMQAWWAELQTAGWSQHDDLFFNHPDGRRWVGYQTGTWLIDQAIKKSGKTVMELTVLPADDIFELAGLNKKGK